MFLILILRLCFSFCALYIPFHFLFKERKCNYALNCSHFYHNASKCSNNERKKKLLQRYQGSKKSWAHQKAFYSLHFAPARHVYCMYLKYGSTGCWVFKQGVQNWKKMPKNQHTQREFLNFENWCNGEVSKSALTRLWKSIFCVKNHQNLSHFFSLKNINLGAHFLLLTFFDNINF